MPTDANIKRRHNERLCEKLKQKRHGKLLVNYPEDENEEVEYRHTRFLTDTDWYQWETKEWYLKEEELPAVGKGHDSAQ